MSPKVKKKSEDLPPDSEPLDTDQPDVDESDADPGLDYDDRYTLSDDATRDLLAAEDAESRIELRRDEPETWNDIDIAGFLEDIPKTVKSIEGYICSKYGGGRYQVNKRYCDGPNRGGFILRKKVKISGYPIVPAAQGSVQASGQVSVGPFEVNGVPVGGTDQEFEKMMQRMMIIERFMPKTNNINDTLLTLALQKNEAPNLIENLEQMTTLIEVAKSFTGETTGKTIPDLIDNAIDKFGDLITERSKSDLKSKGVRGSRQPLLSLGTGQKAEPPTAENSEITKENEGESMAGMTKLDIAKGQAVIIVSHFRLDPRTSVQDVVDVIDASYYLSPVDRSDVVKWKTVLLNMALGVCSDQEMFAEDTTLQVAFRGYFNDVFDLYVDSERRGLLDE